MADTNKKETTEEEVKKEVVAKETPKADVNEVMANMQREIARLQAMVGEVGDRSRVERFLKKEQQERERAGVVERTCFVQMFEGKIVTEWSSMSAANNKVYVNRKGNLVEELTIPYIKLVDPVTNEESQEDNIDYRMFHQTRTHTPASVVEILEEKYSTDGRTVVRPRSYVVEVEGLEGQFTVGESFIN